MPESESSKRGQSIGHVFKSVFSSFLGVQSNKTREEDFQQGRAGPYIVVGLIVTVLFILTVWGVVSLVTRLAAN